jgi:glycosyltransferase involved in cell wall biosynthesis
LGLEQEASKRFLEWLKRHPQDVIVTSDVSEIEACFEYLPMNCLHVVYVHDSMKRYRMVAIRHFANIDGVVCVARHIYRKVAADLTKLNFPGKVSYIHNGANFPPALIRAATTNVLQLLFIGRVEALKGVFDLVPLLRALERLNVPAKLRIVGGFNDRLNNLFERNGLTQHVDWVGKVPHARCFDLAAESDIFLMTSRKEPFGMVTIEAMSMGCVPIAYDGSSGSSEIIQPGQSGILVPQGDVKRMAIQIKKLNEDRELLLEMSKRASKRAREDFTSERMARRWVTFINSLSGNDGKSLAERRVGFPQETAPRKWSISRSYQKLPERLRLRIKERICSYPKLAYWWLNR